MAVKDMAHSGCWLGISCSVYQFKGLTLLSNDSYSVENILHILHIQLPGVETTFSWDRLSTPSNVECTYQAISLFSPDHNNYCCAVRKRTYITHAEGNNLEMHVSGICSCCIRINLSLTALWIYFLCCRSKRSSALNDKETFSLEDKV